MKKYIYFIPSILWMIVIFMMSHQVGDTSSAMSNSIVNILLQVIPIDIDTLSFLIRKCAHMFEYFILFILLFYAFKKSFNAHRYVTCYLLSVLYACSDEFHQLFVPGRGGAITDVLIDSIGITIACILIFTYFKANKKSQ